MLFRRFTITLRCAMNFAPLARFAVTTRGSISGVRPTAVVTPKRKALAQSLVRPFTMNTTGTITSMSLIRVNVTFLMPWSNAVSGRAPTIADDMLPK